jgi:hypothetical protein
MKARKHKTTSKKPKLNTTETKTKRTQARKPNKKASTSSKSDSDKKRAHEQATRLWRAAERMGLRPSDVREFPDLRNAAKLKTSEVTDSLIALANHLDRECWARISERVERINSRVRERQQARAAAHETARSNALAALQDTRAEKTSQITSPPVPVAQIAAEHVKTRAAKATKDAKAPHERDFLGNRIGSSRADMNKFLSAKKPAIVEDVAAALNVPKSRVRYHFEDLLLSAGYVKRQGKGFVLTGKKYAGK